MRRLPLVALGLSSACAGSPADIDGIYSRPGDSHITCGFNLDDKNSVSTDGLNAALDRAQLEGTVVHLYSHQSTATVDPSTIETVVAAAAARGLATTTYHQLANGIDLGPALALSFDDRAIADWNSLSPMFANYNTKVTFFISQYGTFDDEAKVGLLALRASGHDIQYHSTAHSNATDYALTHGIEAYIGDDILPDLLAMREDGYEPTVFAYPFGARTPDIDEALRPYFTLLRGSHFSCPR